MTTRPRSDIIATPGAHNPRRPAQWAPPRAAAPIPNRPPPVRGELFVVQTADLRWHAAAIGPGILCDRNGRPRTLTWRTWTAAIVDCADCAQLAAARPAA